MNDYIPDPMELMESRIDRMEEELDCGDPDMLLCAGCGIKFDMCDLSPSSSAPDAAPMCDQCLWSRGILPRPLE